MQISRYGVMDWSQRRKEELETEQRRKPIVSKCPKQSGGCFSIATLTVELCFGRDENFCGYKQALPFWLSRFAWTCVVISLVHFGRCREVVGHWRTACNSGVCLVRRPHSRVRSVSLVRICCRTRSVFFGLRAASTRRVKVSFWVATMSTYRYVYRVVVGDQRDLHSRQIDGFS